MNNNVGRLMTIAAVTLLAGSCNSGKTISSQDETGIDPKEAVPTSTIIYKDPTQGATSPATQPPPAVTVILPTDRAIETVITMVSATNTPTAAISTPVPLEMTETAEPVLGPIDYPVGINPLTGQKVTDLALLERRPLAIKISNYPRYVRPQSGLNVADMVWEHYAEGGTSRYTAVYYADAAERIGPIRSARLIDLTLVDMLDSALVASGTSQGTLDRLWLKPWYAAVVTRANGYDCPPLCQENLDTNSMFTSASDVWQALDDRGQNTAPTILGLTFHSIVPIGGQPATVLRVDFSQEAHSEWRYNKASNRYERWIDISATELEAHIDAYTGDQIQADNVAILFANHIVDFTIPEDFDADGIHANFATEIQLWGSGPAMLLRDGQVFSGTWMRDDAAKMPSLTDNNGEQLPLRPGKSWIYTTHLRSNMDQSGSEWIIVHRSPRDRGKLILPTEMAGG